MIKLRDARLTDGLPQAFSAEPWAVALSAVFQAFMRSALDAAEGIRLGANLEAVPEPVLDVMAIDLQAPGYDTTLDIETKRALIRSAMVYYSGLGTKAAVESICREIFGDADVLEWSDYGGQPYRFKINTVNPSVTGDTLEAFKRSAISGKRLSAWLDGVTLTLAAPPARFYTGAVVSDLSRHPFKIQI